MGVLINNALMCMWGSPTNMGRAFDSAPTLALQTWVLFILMRDGLLLGPSNPMLLIHIGLVTINTRSY